MLIYNVYISFGGERLSEEAASVREAAHEQLGLPASLVNLPGKPARVLDPYHMGQDNAPWALLNHSRKNPNVVAKPFYKDGQCHIMLMTMSIVPPGFEYRWDYCRLTRQRDQPAWLDLS